MAKRKNYTDIVVKVFKAKDFADKMNETKNKGISTLKKWETKNYINMFLIIAVIVFVVSIAYSVSVTANTENTQASENKDKKIIVRAPTLPPSNANEEPPLIIQKLKSVPNQYNGEAIPETIYEEIKKEAGNTDSEYIKRYAIRSIGEFYIYKDVLSTNGLTLTENDLYSDVDYKFIKDSLPEMRGLIDDEIVTNLDFAYVTAWVSGPNETHHKKVREQFNTDAEVKTQAETLLNKYVELFQTQTNTAEEIVAMANEDKDLVFLTGDEPAGIKNNYTHENNLYSLDEGFNDFLFEQTAYQVSEIYKLKDKEKTFAMVIIFPIEVQITDYKNADDVIESKIDNFSVK
jgi:hypothetical protein